MTKYENNYETINNYNRYLHGVKENAIRSFRIVRNPEKKQT